MRDLFVAQSNGDPALGDQAISILKSFRDCGFNDCIHVKTTEALVCYDRTGTRFYVVVVLTEYIYF